MDLSIDANRVFQSKIKNIMANSVDPDETAYDEMSHLDLHCLHRYLFWSAGLKGLTLKVLITTGGDNIWIFFFFFFFFDFSERIRIDILCELSV